MKKTQSRAHQPFTATFPIVAMGASSGGLDSFKKLLKEIPNHTGMAFVLIQHLEPTRSSLLTQAIAKVTKMKVFEIKDGMRLKPNQVYVIPPTSEVGILQGKFVLFARDQHSRKPNRAINFFFRALAIDCGSRSVGVVLSGNATDGTDGLRAIKEVNGFTFVQDPETAEYNEMPKSAVDAEVADYCLPIPQLAQELVRLASHPALTKVQNVNRTQASDLPHLKKIFAFLRETAGVDYSQYKSPTINRRIARRMALQKIESLPDYIQVLQNAPEEITALASDLLIHVTSFFRDPLVFRSLPRSVFAPILKNKSAGSAIRVWVAGCSSGEEVYSLAISLLEFLESRGSEQPIQMFGSDLSEKMIVKARAGFYPEIALADVEAKILKKYFIKVEGGYRISKQIRDLCLFVRHDLARDPPFSKLDLVTCRNVLIYLEPPLQKKIVSTFHYCLNQPGFLLLGKTETISAHHRLFSSADKAHKLYSRIAVESQLRFSSAPHELGTGKSLVPVLIEPVHATPNVSKRIDHLLLTRYAPAGVVINDRMEVLQYRGRTGPFLEPPPGQPQTNLLKMIREGLFSPLKTAIDEAKNKLSTVRKENLKYKYGTLDKICNLVVDPVTQFDDAKETVFLILFESVVSPALMNGKKKPASSKKARLAEEVESNRAAKLEHELRATQDYLHALNEEHQKANETLNSVNEEFISGNEELQSMNEELETAKEELQSTNEELTTVNDELQNRNLETVEINDDLVNLLNSVEIPILILDLHRRIRRFTPKARSMMNLLPADIGRAIDDIKLNIDIKNLDQLVQDVIETAVTHESEVQDRSGKWHRLQIRPYKTTDHKIAGAVLSLINIDMLRRAVIDAEWVRDYSASIVEAVQIPLLVLNEKIQVISANRVFYDGFRTTRAETEGKSLYDLHQCQWNEDILKSALGEMLEKKTFFQNMELNCDFFGAAKVMDLSARAIQSIDGNYMILLAIEDITERKNIEKDKRDLLQMAQDAKTEADKANLTKDLFLATLSHELRTPLTSLLLQAQMLQRGSMDEARIKKASQSIERAVRVQTQLIEDLLDVSRIVTGKLKMERTTVDLNDVIHTAIETVTAAAESKAVTIITHLDLTAGKILGDSVRLQQVIWNLLTNAIKFTKRGESITVILKASGKKAVIQVIDQGMGISSEFLPHVFRRFSQAEETSTRTHGGLGLGLAIVRHLVEMHEGTAEVSSEGENKGATFTITLPLMRASSQKADAVASIKDEVFAVGGNASEARIVKLDGLKILLVEDDIGAREALTEIMILAGAEVQAAGSAVEAMEILNHFYPDGLVLDLSMPGENGFSLLRRIRKAHESVRQVPAMALTALASERDREEAFAAGFQMHLTKPVDIEHLTGALYALTEFKLKD